MSLCLYIMLKQLLRPQNSVIYERVKLISRCKWLVSQQLSRIYCLEISIWLQTGKSSSQLAAGFNMHQQSQAWSRISQACEWANGKKSPVIWRWKKITFFWKKQLIFIKSNHFLMLSNIARINTREFFVKFKSSNVNSAATCLRQ